MNMENIDVIVADVIEFLRTFVEQLKKAFAGISIKFRFEKTEEEAE